MLFGPDGRLDSLRLDSLRFLWRTPRANELVGIGLGLNCFDA